MAEHNIVFKLEDLLSDMQTAKEWLAEKYGEEKAVRAAQILENLSEQVSKADADFETNILSVSHKFLERKGRYTEDWYHALELWEFTIKLWNERAKRA